MPSRLTEEVFRLLQDERFIQLRLMADREILLWSDMSGFEMPAGLTQEETWAILTGIRRQTATMLPWKSYLDIGYAADGWYVNTRAMSLILNEFGARCGRGSALDQAVAAHSGTHVIARQVEQDLLAAFERDGVYMDSEKVHSIFLGDRRSEDGYERLIANFAKLISDLDNYATRKIRPGLVEELHHRLTEGTEDVAPPQVQCRPRVAKYPHSEYNDPDASMRVICRMAGDDLDEPLIHPLIRAICVSWFFWDFPPLPSWNALVEILVRRLVLARWGYPVFGWIPLSRICLAWEKGLVVTPRSWSAVLETTEKDCGYGVDGSAMISSILQLMLDEVDTLEAIVRQLDILDQDLQQSLSHHPSINSRQRVILSNALRSPEKAQRIDPHRRLFQVSYATARSDYLGLVERGYLLKGQQDKAFVFWPHPDLKRIISEGRASGTLANHQRGRTPSA